MKSEYQLSLELWAKNLTNDQLSNYMNFLERFSDQELDVLFFEDCRRLGNIDKTKIGSWIKGTDDDDEGYEYIPSAAELS
jgi:hypothetical protein